jgi:hypothetical protein
MSMDSHLILPSGIGGAKSKRVIVLHIQAWDLPDGLPKDGKAGNPLENASQQNTEIRLVELEDSDESESDIALAIADAGHTILCNLLERNLDCDVRVLNKKRAVLVDSAGNKFLVPTST